MELSERLFDIEFQNTVLEEYLNRCDAPEELDLNQKSKEILYGMLPPEKRAAFVRMEQLIRSNQQYALQFGFCKGVVCRVKYPIACDRQALFAVCVEQELLTEPSMRRYTAYAERRNTIVELMKELEAQLDDITHDYLLKVFSSWENQLYGIISETFRLGWNTAEEYI